MIAASIAVTSIVDCYTFFGLLLGRQVNADSCVAKDSVAQDCGPGLENRHPIGCIKGDDVAFTRGHTADLNICGVYPYALLAVAELAGAVGCNTDVVANELVAGCGLHRKEEHPVAPVAANDVACLRCGATDDVVGALVNYDSVVVPAFAIAGRVRTNPHAFDPVAAAG